MSEALTNTLTKTDVSAATLLRATQPRPQERAVWSRRLDELVASDRHRQRAFVAAGAAYAAVGCSLAPLGLAVVTGTPLPPSTAWGLSVAALVSLFALPAALLWRRLARHRHRALLVALHDRGASFARDADGWVLRDRHLQLILAARPRSDADTGREDLRTGGAETAEHRAPAGLQRANS